MFMRNYKKEREHYHSRPEQMLRNAARKRARRFLEREGKAKTHDGKDVHHKDNNPLNNDKNNLSLVTQHYNRKEPRLREKKLKEWLEAADIQESLDVKKALSKVKGLSRKQTELLLALPNPILMNIVQQLSGLVMGDVKEYMQNFEEEMGTVTGTGIAGTGDDSSTVIVKKKKKMLKRMLDTINYNRKGGHNVQ